MKTRNQKQNKTIGYDGKGFKLIFFLTKQLHHLGMAHGNHHTNTINIEQEKIQSLFHCIKCPKFY